MIIDETVWLLMLNLSIPGLIIGFGFGLVVALIITGFTCHRYFMKGRESMFEEMMERRQK